jgi:hypothetical protein
VKGKVTANPAYRRGLLRAVEIIDGGGSVDDVRAEAAASEARRRLRDQRMVYFAYSTSRDLVKIGSSARPEHRVNQVDFSDAVLFATMPGGERVELQIHAKFDRYRRLGEWFAPEPEMMSWIAHSASCVGQYGIGLRARMRRLRAEFGPTMAPLQDDTERHDATT